MPRDTTHGVRLELLAEVVVRPLVLCHHEQPCRVSSMLTEIQKLGTRMRDGAQHVEAMTANM